MLGALGTFKGHTLGWRSQGNLTYISKIREPSTNVSLIEYAIRIQWGKSFNWKIIINANIWSVW